MKSNFAKWIVAALMLVFLVALAIIWPIPPNEGYAEGASTKLAGKNVVAVMATSPNKPQVVEDLTGKVTGADDIGIWLETTKRNLYSKKRQTFDYKATVFLPWTSVLYLKILK